MYKLIAAIFLILCATNGAIAVNIKHQHKPEKITFRILAVEDPIPPSSFSLNRDSLLVVLIDRQKTQRLARLAFIYMGYEYPFPVDLLDYELLHTFAAVRDRSCDETWQSFSTKAQIGSAGTLVMSNVLTYTAPDAMPDVSAEEVLPCYVVRGQGYKGSHRLALSGVEMSVATAKEPSR